MMRLAWIIILALLTFGCSEQGTEANNPGDDMSEFGDMGGGEFGGGKDGKPAAKDGKPSTTDTTSGEAQSPKQSMTNFLNSIMTKNHKEAMKYVDINGQNYYTSRKHIRLQKLYILDTIKTSEFTEVKTNLYIQSIRGGTDKIRQSFLVRQSGNIWQAYASKKGRFVLEYGSFKRKKYERTAIYGVKWIKKQQSKFRVWGPLGRYGKLRELIKHQYLPRRAFNGDQFKGYQYMVRPTFRGFNIAATPLIVIPPHRSFYADESNIIRYNPTGTSPGPTSLSLGTRRYKEEKPVFGISKN